MKTTVLRVKDAYNKLRSFNESEVQQIKKGNVPMEKFYFEEYQCCGITIAYSEYYTKKMVGFLHSSGRVYIHKERLPQDYVTVHHPDLAQQLMLKYNDSGLHIVFLKELMIRIQLHKSKIYNPELFQLLNI